jgi:translocation and assembly module TamB
MRLLRILALALLLPGTLFAQEESGATFLERTLESNLSGAGRDVRVTGFRGALSSAATIERLTIADDQGIWLSLEGVTLDWSRSALLRGRLLVENLTADSIDLARLPGGQTDGDVPAPEASGFRLPELPLSVNIGRIASPSITIGEPVFGLASAFSLEGALSLEGGEGSGSIDIARLDGPQGIFAIDAAFSNATGILTIDAALTEAQGGIVATLAGLPGEPSLDLDVAGEGPLTNFEATLSLATDGEPRLAGSLAIGGDGLAPGDPRPFRAQLSGDVVPLFAPAYRDFFGPEVALDVAGTRGAGGAMELDTFRLDASALTLDGSLSLGPGGTPQRFALEGLIADPDGSAVLLPIPGEETRVGRVALTASFDAASGNAWQGLFRIDGLDRAGFSAEEVTLDGGGTIAQGAFAVDLDFAAEALDLADPAAASSLGERVTGRIVLESEEGQPLRIDRLDLNGESYALESSGTIDIADRDLAITGQARISASDLSVFAGVAQRPLRGAAELDLSGSGTLLGGTFDVQVDGRTTDLAVGIPQVDNIVPGTTRLALGAARDLDGITLRAFRLSSPVASVSAEGVIRSADTRLSLSATLDDGTLVLPGLAGRHVLSLDVQGGPEAWILSGDLSGPTLSGSVDGRLAGVGARPAFDGTVTIDATSLAPLAGRAGLPGLRGAAALAFDGAVTADLSRFDFRLTGTGADIVTGLPTLDPLLTGELSLALDAGRLEGGGIDIRSLSVATGTISLDGEADVTGLPTALVPPPPDLFALDPVPVIAGRLALRAADLAPAAGLTGLPGLDGALEAALQGSASVDLSRFDLDLTAEANGLALGLPGIDPLVSQGLTAAFRAAREAGAARIATLSVRTPAISLSADGTVTGLPGALVPPSAEVTDAIFSGRVSLDASRLAPAGPLARLPGLDGTLRATLDGRVGLDLDRFDIRLDAAGTNLRSGIAAADAYLAGDTVLALDAVREGTNFTVRRADLTASGLTARAEGFRTPTTGRVSGEVRLDNLGRIVEGFSGPATARFTAGASGPTAPWAVQSTVEAPGGVTLRLDGTAGRALERVDLAVRGEVPLGLANTFIQPRSVSGRAAVDLRVSGPPALSSVSGRITSSDLRVVDPGLGLVLENVSAAVDLSGSRARVDVTAPVQGGGRILVTGPVGLTAPFAGDLRVVFDNARVRDPTLYDTTVSGAITLSGPLMGGANVAGRLALGQTEIRIPSSISGGTAPIPEITHVAEPRPVRETRIRAGIIGADGRASGSDDGGGPVYGLDVRIDALNEIFIRGRGLDAELGGSLRIGGTTANVIPAGQFELIRGRLDILGRRLVLDEGSITLQGSLDPFLFLAASSDADGITVRVVLRGNLSDPELRFESTPELPEDEVVARLLFGRGINEISAFQAAQLASSIATLTGRGGDGILGSLRRSFGLDDLDVGTSETGETELTLGTYLSDNVYTDVAISDGRTELDINLELTPSITVTGSTADDGDSSIGIRFERDF